MINAGGTGLVSQNNSDENSICLSGLGVDHFLKATLPRVEAGSRER